MSSTFSVDQLFDSTGSGAPSVPAGISVPLTAVGGNTYSTIYTPTFSNPVGGSSFGVPGPMMVTRVGNIVTVWGKVGFTSSAGLTQWSMTVPIPRTDGNFTQLWQAQGHTTRATGTPNCQAGAIEADSGGSQLVNCNIAVPSGNTAGAAHVSFSYSLVNI